MSRQTDKRTAIRDEAKKLAALLIDAPDKAITPEMLDLARAVFRMASETKGNKDKLSIEAQHFLVDYIDNQLISQGCTSKEEAASKLRNLRAGNSAIESDVKNSTMTLEEKQSLLRVYNNLQHEFYPNGEQSNPFVRLEEKSLVAIYNKLKKNRNLIASKKD